MEIRTMIRVNQTENSETYSIREKKNICKQLVEKENMREAEKKFNVI